MIPAALILILGSVDAIALPARDVEVQLMNNSSGKVTAIRIGAGEKSRFFKIPGTGMVCEYERDPVTDTREILCVHGVRRKPAPALLGASVLLDCRDPERRMAALKLWIPGDPIKEAVLLFLKCVDGKDGG